MKTKFFLAPLGLALAMLPQAAFADVTTTFDSHLGGNGFYNGTTTDDGHFAITLANYGGGDTIQIGLRGVQRTIGPITPTDNNNYACVAGEQCNFDWSVAITGSLHVGDFTYGISIQNLTTNQNLFLNPFAFPDNAVVGTTGFQNSEYLGYNFLKIPLDYHPTDQLAIYFTATPTNSSLADPSVAMGFNTSVPEPSALVLTSCFAGFLGFASLLVRKFQKV